MDPELIEDIYLPDTWSSYSRRISRVVNIGDTPVGGAYPIRVQSMTNTPTMDTAGTAEQVIRLVKAGCEYVRITAQGVKEAEQLANIKKLLFQRGIKVPLIADIHFNPEAAEVAARIVEKVRINPGNYADKKKFESAGYTDQQYKEELERVAARFHPLLRICKENGTAIRIGVNHGSLSDRIMSRFGDTPAGMVESAMEFLRICRIFGFEDLVLSMKSSSIRITTYATRLLVTRMQAEQMFYPIHLGVTEAGNEEDGRIKSASGIGTLLEDGIGDTLRVSLTEDPENEIPVALSLASKYNRRISPVKTYLTKPNFVAYFDYQKRKTRRVGSIGGGQGMPVVTTCWGIAGIDCFYFHKPVFTPDFIFNPPHIPVLRHPTDIPEIIDYSAWLPDIPNSFPFFEAPKYLSSKKRSDSMNFVLVTPSVLSHEFIAGIKDDPTVVLVFETRSSPGPLEIRKMFSQVIREGCECPVIIKRLYRGLGLEQLQLYSAIDFSLMLTDGLGDGIWLEGDPHGICKFPTKTAFDILQATGDRITRTDYIACPSCGRTQFNIQEALGRIRESTAHLKGLKIAVMGCVVNGPGEMADAHYGYVGAGPGKINLYKGKEVIKRGIAEDEAVEELVKLIKDSGDWVER